MEVGDERGRVKYAAPTRHFVNNMGNGVWWQSTSYATGVRNSGHCMVAGSTIYGGCEYANSVNRTVAITLSLTYETTT